MPATGAVTLVVHSGALIDGTGAEPVRDGYVLVSGDRIVKVGSGDVEVPEGAEVIDAEGGTILPGLIDAHVHVTRHIVGGGGPAGQPGLRLEAIVPWVQGNPLKNIRDMERVVAVVQAGKVVPAGGQ